MPFIPSNEYGGQLAINSRYEELTEESPAVRWAHRNARATLPIGAVYEIRLRIPNNYIRGRSLAWYYALGLEDLPWMERMQVAPYGGYIFFGLYRVEGAEVNVGQGPTEESSSNEEVR